jgi:putative transposase
LNARRSDNLLEAKLLVDDWRIDYKVNRPDAAHGEFTPS